MSETAEILLERIDRRLAELDRSRYWLSKAVTDGRSAGVITDLARKRFLPAEPRLNRMAEQLGVSVDWLMGRTDNPAPVMSEVTVSDRALPWRGPEPELPGIPLVGTGDCAELTVETAAGGQVEIERNSFDPDFHVRMIARPPALRGAQDLYAIYFHGTSMSPRFEPGEIGIVDPRRPAGPGDDVVVQLRAEGDDAVVSVLVKRLVRRGGGRLTLRQFNPDLEFDLPLNLVAAVHRIVPQTEMLL